MKLRGTDWPPVFNSSGARGFDGQGYWFHKPWAHFGLDYTGSCFVAKTTTLQPRAGNMPLNDQLQPKEWTPKCIVVKPFKGVVLNSVGLSGPGAPTLIDRWSYHWPQLHGQNWMISFMSVAPGAMERIEEAASFFSLLPRLSEICGKDKLGLQINVSCPNVGLDVTDAAPVVEEVAVTLHAARNLDVPVLLKLNALVEPSVAKTMAAHSRCDGIIVSNTIPWGKLPEMIDWKGLFGSETSPLAHLGGGGLSGRPLKRIVGEWVKAARIEGIDKPIIAGGGILNANDADYLLECGADGIELGSVSILRPWRVRGIIRHVNTRAQWLWSTARGEPAQ